MVARSALALLTLALFAGCSDNEDTSNPTPVTPTKTITADACPTSTPTSTVSGFSIHGGNWSDPSTGPICGEGEKALNVLLSNGLGPFADVEVSGSFEMLERSLPEFDAGAGLVIHYADDKNYQIIRYSPREQGWHLFTMMDGTRTKQDTASVTPPTTNPDFAELVTLKVVSDDGHITAFHGATKVIDFTLPAGASTTGGVGYFLRAQQAAEFEGLTAKAI